MAKRTHSLLFVLPFVYLVITGVFLVHWSPFYKQSPDPVYAYLFNGTTIASGSLEIGHTDHPGTPVQCFVAGIIFIKHLFNPAIPLYQDVLLHPESYLYVICLIISLLFVLVTWVTGYYILKRTGNIMLALLFQLTPLVGTHCIFYAQNPQPESFIIITGILYMAYVYYQSVTSGGITTFKHVLICGIFSGFLIACKYTCAPLLLLGLFVVPGWKRKVQYVILSIIFFIVFIAPVLHEWKNMLTWVTNLATHTGHYGTGDEGIVNPEEFKSHLIAVFVNDFYFTTIYVVSTLALLLAFVYRKQVEKSNRIYINLLAGVWFSMTSIILLVAKHFSPFYLLPANLCFPIAIASTYNVFYNIKMQAPKSLVKYAFYILTGIFVYTGVKEPLSYFFTKPDNSTENFLDKYTDKPVLICTSYGCARVEPSLYFGAAYTANYHYKYLEFLKKAYPKSYLYNMQTGDISYWDDVSYIPEMLKRSPQLLVYFYNNSQEEVNDALQNMGKGNNNVKLATYTCLYTNKQNKEYIYLLNANEDSINAIMDNYTDMNFDLEKLTKDSSCFIASDGAAQLKVSTPLIHTEHHSGSISVLMDSSHKYSLQYTIKAAIGSIVKVKVWEKSADFRCDIVLTGNNGNFYRSGHALIDSGAQGWKQIEYSCLIPASVQDSTIQFYMFYYGDKKAYLDDLSIRTYPMKLNAGLAKKD